jgi:hypothetical protein
LTDIAGVHDCLNGSSILLSPTSAIAAHANLVRFD